MTSVTFDCICDAFSSTTHPYKIYGIKTKNGIWIHNLNWNSNILHALYIPIGAQDLLKQTASVSHSGFLRKRGKLERFVGSNGLFKALFSELSKCKSMFQYIYRLIYHFLFIDVWCFYWTVFVGRQRFVIIGRGCLYIYADEQGRAPLQSVSLKGYSK